MSDRCYAGVPDEQGHGGCRAYERSTKLAGELDSAALLCQWCLEPAERDVRALVLDYRDLEQLLPPSLGVWAYGTRGGADSPLPLRGSVLDLQIDIWWLVTAWCDVVRDVDRLSDAPSHVRSGWAVQDAVRILAPRLHLLAEIETAVMWSYPGSQDRCSEVPGWRGVLDLARLHQRALGTLGLTRAMPEMCVGVPCRNEHCDQKALYREPGKDSVRCGACDLYYSAREYAEWSRWYGRATCGQRNGDWYCALGKGHTEGCEPAPNRRAA